MDVRVTGLASWLQAELRMAGANVERAEGVLISVEAAWRASR